MDDKRLELPAEAELPPVPQPLPEPPGAAAPELPEPEPAMRGTRWLVGGVALPGTLLCAVLWRILSPYVLALDPARTAVWAGSAALACAAIAASVWALSGRKRLPGPFWAGVSGAYCALLGFGGWALLDLDLYDSDLLLIACSLAMVVIIASMLRVIVWLTPPGKRHSVGKPFLSVLAIPVFYYLLFTGLRYAYNEAWISILLVMAVVCTYGFVLLLVRTLYLTLLRWDRNPILRIIVVFALPVIALFVSQSDPFRYMFWDFSSPVYYLLVLLNGALLLVPEPRGAFRLPLHFARGATTLFVLYFFVCLSPFYALSLIGVAAFGAGILVLAPLFLLLYQGKVLLTAFRGLRADHGRLAPVAVFLLGMALIPACMALYFAGDRENVQTAMRYVDGSAGEDIGQVDIPALDRSIRYMTGGWSESRNSPPLLTGLYNRTVIGSRVLSQQAYQRARVLFWGDTRAATQLSDSTPTRSGTTTVVVSDIEVDTVREGDDYRTTLHLTIQNTGKSGNAEYATTFSLPEGVYISGYYLDVNGTRKQGMLSVRDAAVWIYERTVSRARDPGILYYNGDEVVFRVFPFAPGEVRKTGIELLHRDKVTLELAGRSLEIAPDADRLTEPVVGQGAAFFSAATKLALEPAARTPYYVFLVDCSRAADREELVERVKRFCGEYGIAPEEAAVVARNYRSATWRMDADWESELRRFPAEGGFGLAGALDRVYSEFADAGSYPVAVVVSDAQKQMLRGGNAAYAAAQCPELAGYLHLGAMELSELKFAGGETEVLARPADPRPVLVAQIEGHPVYLHNDGRPQVVTTALSAAASPDDGGSAWEAGLRLDGLYSRLQAAQGGEQERARLELMQDSMRTGIMTPLTSYIVLETIEQEAALLARQQQLLAGGGAQGEAAEAVPMSEPPLLVCLVLAGAVWWMLRRRRRVMP